MIDRATCGAPWPGPRNAGAVAYSGKARLNERMKRIAARPELSPSIRQPGERRPLDVDPHWYALREPHPGEDRIDVCKPHRIRLRIRRRNAARETTHFAQNDLAVSHQLDLRRIPFVVRGKSRLFEIGVDPE
jgi:hypothetical protein